MVVSAVVLGPSGQRATRPDPEVDSPLDLVIPVAEQRHPSREVYPYSVVPGGVYNATEIADAVANDPTVAEHYADVTPAAMRVELVHAVREAYMSYRIGDRIFWTRRKLPLRAGERILTDGDVAIRARCGNRLSDVPRTPTSDAEPAVYEFERDAAPVLPVGPGPDSRIATGPPLGLWPGGSVPLGLAPTSDGMPPAVDGGSPGAFFDRGGFYGDVGIPPIGGAGVAPGNAEPDGEQPQGNPGDVPSVNAEIPGSSDFDHPEDENGGSSGESPGETSHIPETFGASEGELPIAAVPEPTTLTLLGTGLLWGAVKRHRRHGARNGKKVNC